MAYQQQQQMQQSYQQRPRFSQTLPSPGQQQQQYQEVRRVRRVRRRPTWENTTLSYERSLGFMPPSLHPTGVPASYYPNRARAMLGKDTMYRSEPRYKFGTTRDIRSAITANYQLARPGINPRLQSPVIITHPVNLAELNKTGTPVGDKKPSGVSRNDLGGFFTT